MSFLSSFCYFVRHPVHPLSLCVALDFILIRNKTDNYKKLSLFPIVDTLYKYDTLCICFEYFTNLMDVCTYDDWKVLIEALYNHYRSYSAHISTLDNSCRFVFCYLNINIHSTIDLHSVSSFIDSIISGLSCVKLICY